MSAKNNSTNRNKILSCPVDTTPQVPLTCDQVTPFPLQVPFIKVPVLLKELKTQICTEADIELDPPASEIKRIRKDVCLTQCKFVPVKFDGTQLVVKAKLFIGGFIRKNIEYATDECNGRIRDKIADVPFSGCCELDSFETLPTLMNTSDNVARFIAEDGMSPRQDKYFFENSVFYNEQPFCEIVSANFFEVDFSPSPTSVNGTFDRLREKIVVDLTLKVLQVQQVISNAGAGLTQELAESLYIIKQDFDQYKNNFDQYKQEQEEFQKSLLAKLEELSTPTTMDAKK